MGTRRTARPGVVRFAISLDGALAEQFDRWVAQRNSASRSEAVRFLIRRELAETAPGSDPDADTVGAVLLLYRHDAPNVLRRLAAAQHRWGDHVRSSTHVHLPGDACAEIILLLGKRREIERAAEDLRGVKGIREGRFVLTSPGVAGGRSGHRHPHAALNRRSNRPARISGFERRRSRRTPRRLPAPLEVAR